jgi:hypothetical protein
MEPHGKEARLVSMSAITARNAYLSAKAKPAKAARELHFGLHLLQAFEIPQNHQDILWKSLEKTSGNLEILGKSLEAAGHAEG